jgi:hypothetical protein
MGYRVSNVDLSTTFDDFHLVEPGTRVRALLVTKFAAGSDLQVAIGGQGYFYIPSVGSLDMDPGDYTATAYGITLRNTIAQPGITVQFVVIPVGDL